MIFRHIVRIKFLNEPLLYFFTQLNCFTYFYLIQLIRFIINHLDSLDIKHLYLTQRFGPCQVLPMQARVDLGAIEMIGHYAFSKSSALLELDHQTVYCHILDTHFLTPQRRSNRCILQPQPTRPDKKRNRKKRSKNEEYEKRITKNASEKLTSWKIKKVWKIKKERKILKRGKNKITKRKIEK